MKLALRLIGLAGLLLFGLGFAMTWLSPIHYERAGRAFIQAQLEAQVRERVEFAGNERLERTARALAARHEDRIAHLRQQLASGLNAHIAAVVAQMQNLDCECRRRLAEGLDYATHLRIAELERAEPQLRRLIEGRYGEIVADLLYDLRLFTGINALAFVLLLLVSFLKPAAIAHLFVPGVLLAVAATLASALYLFGQNWFFTLLYSSYVGTAYAAWLLAIYAFLCDIALNRARVTTWLLNALANAIGSLARFSPC